MKPTTHNGFTVIEHPDYPPEKGDNLRLVQESSAVGDYDDSFDVPGSSFLWVGKDHHLNREEVWELTTYLLHWLRTGRLQG